MKKFLILMMLCMCATAFAGNNKGNDDTRVVFIMIDGLRWQEVFGGVDAKIIADKRYVSEPATMEKRFVRPTSQQARAALMPFVWNKVKDMGLIIGNRWKNSRMQVANHMHFSYPGYSESMCGFPDDEHVNSNDLVNNPNQTIMEIANKDSRYKGRVLCFGSWDCFPYIINEQRSGLEVNAGYRHSLSKNPTKEELLINEMQDQTPAIWSSVRFDVFTYHYALEAMKSRKPKFVYIGFGETDDFAHEGRYDQYVMSANRADEFIGKLWDYCQSDPFYKGKTTFIITCDHGRGDGASRPDDWKDHGEEIKNSEQTWLIAFGKNVPARGEESNNGIFYNKQVAPTIAQWLGVAFTPAHKDAGKPFNF